MAAFRDCDVVVLGSSNVDLVTTVERLPNKGETVHGTSFAQHFGGKGANQAVQCARLGSKTRFIGAVGGDDNGRSYLEHLTKVPNMDTSCVRVAAGTSTGVAQISVDAAAQNTIVVVAGANGTLSPEDVLLCQDSAAFRGAKVLLCQLENPRAATLAAVEAARESGTLSIINTAPAPESDDPAALATLLAAPDIICCNEPELSLISGGMPTSTQDEIDAAATAVLARGCQSVLVTMGARGACFYSFVSKGLTKALKVPTNEVSPLDTTGAGDSFLGALAHGLSRCRHTLVGEGADLMAAMGEGMAEGPAAGNICALEAACQCASLSVLAPGAQSSFPTADQIEHKRTFDAAINGERPPPNLWPCADGIRREGYYQ